MTILRFVNTLRPRQDGRHFADDIFKCIFLNEDIWILINISLKFVLKGPINNITALVQIMAWRHPGDKPLSEPMIMSLMTHICITRPWWVNGGGEWYFLRTVGHVPLFFPLIKTGWGTFISMVYDNYFRLIAKVRDQGVVSQTYHELAKIISWKYTTPEITFMVKISSWNFVRVPKAWLWAHVQSFSLKFSSQVLFLRYTHFERIFWRARETLVKQPPVSQRFRSL